MGKEIIQNFHLVLRQFRALSVIFQPAALRMEHRSLPGKSLETFFLFRIGKRAIQQRRDLRQQDRDIVGLGDERVSACHDAVQLVHIRIARRYKDDGNVGKLSDPRTERKTALSRQPDIQKDQMRLRLLYHLHDVAGICRGARSENRFTAGSGARGSRYQITVSRQKRLQFLSYFFIIFDDQNPVFHGNILLIKKQICRQPAQRRGLPAPVIMPLQKMEASNRFLQNRRPTDHSNKS